jgi:hypothetical protein
MPRQRTSRIYLKNGRAYADFRDFAPWGGRQEALRAPGAAAATSNLDEAMRICASRLSALEEAKRAHPEGTPEEDPLARIAAFAGYHLAGLEKRRKRGRALTPGSRAAEETPDPRNPVPGEPWQTPASRHHRGRRSRLARASQSVPTTGDRQADRRPDGTRATSLHTLLRKSRSRRRLSDVMGDARRLQALNRTRSTDWTRMSVRLQAIRSRRFWRSARRH